MATTTTTTATDSTVGVFATSDEALGAAKALKDAGYGDDVVSIVGKGVKDEKKVHGWIPVGNEAGTFGGWGALWGALTGWLLLGFVWLPGIGWVAAAGWLASTLVGAGIGAGLGALIGLAVPEDEIPQYEDDLKADRYLVIVHGDGETVDAAHRILDGAGPVRVSRYSE
ncbi:MULTISPECIES: DUF1269 domain-containing protein [unclassified Curtobacterium]|uniref:DUF1269 domain-containing protein n=1 Tax=unclassified Curtobacterium TaxID=257496 RepID=UPI0010E3238F|nr:MULTISPECIES: DUF1269 domain-containing protein [unclassified Curtobacterium]TCL81212.1 uncharacterized protein DUF1269 [Curtobacterium sp. PhB128]TCL99337.1 uncharacterized protein DUF1269 [Curtobacterium sp. PhB138]TCU85804.1 uncharacterized protein DUF1269 [Curtobacterium sp. PhB191]TDW45809.1 uncharacterized protein DUF1269 [Curtobacterium sp. PhB42]TDW57951.1 uncharacterized protein DUF1269 [Curtobacterium sp. PhB190]